MVSNFKTSIQLVAVFTGLYLMASAGCQSENSGNNNQCEYTKDCTGNTSVGCNWICSDDHTCEEECDPSLVELPEAMDPVVEIPYAEIPSEECIIDLDHWDIPSDGTEPVKTTDNLQAAIDWSVEEGCGIVRLPAGHFLIGKYGNDVYQAGISLHSNMAFLLDKNAIIEMAPNDKWNYSTVTVREKSHVVISGGTILGDRYGHTFEPSDSGGVAHDEGHCITVSHESEYVTIENTTLTRATGDGILLVASGSEDSSVWHIDIRNNNIFNNRRQGVSIVGGRHVLIEGNEIHHIRGTAPQFGIDVESLSYYSGDITIRSNHFHHNRGGDIVNTDGRNLLIEDNILEQGEGNERYIDGPLVYYKNSDQTIRRNEITMLTPSVNLWHGIIMYSNDNPKTNPETTFIYENTLIDCGFYMYKSADLEITDNYFTGGHMAFSEMSNLTLTNNSFENSSHFPWIFSFKEVTGTAEGNTHNGEPVEVPLSDEPYTGYL